MADQLVKEWLADYKALSNDEVHSFANIISNNNDLTQAIFTALEEKKYHNELLQPICEQLFTFYRSTEESLRIFSLQFVPTLIGIYLTEAARGKQKNFRCVEVILLGIYNLEILDAEGKAVVWSFRIPSTSKPSIYHEPFGASNLPLTENALSRLEFGDNRVVNIGPFSEIERINASNRLQLMKVLMQIYNRHISLMSRVSHQSLCKICSRIVKQGTGRQRTSVALEVSNCGIPFSQSTPRIPMSADFLLEMIHAVYYSMFNGLNYPGSQTLDDIHFRATLELMPEVLLVSNAIKDSLKTNPSGQPTDGPMGISVALSPTTTSSTVVSKAIITNASFRTKKLPDDIPIQGSDGSGGAGDKHLESITEEGDDEHNARNNSVKVKSGSGSGSNKLPVVLQLRKNKDKKKNEQLAAANEISSSGNTTPTSTSGKTKTRDVDNSSSSTAGSVLKSSLKNSASSRFIKNGIPENDPAIDVMTSSTISRLSDPEAGRGGNYEMNHMRSSGNDQQQTANIMAKKSSSAFNVSSLVSNHVIGGVSDDSTSAIVNNSSSSGRKENENGGLSKYPSAQTVV